jgi:ABC-2 type transport system ATP-binding protein
MRTNSPDFAIEMDAVSRSFEGTAALSSLTLRVPRGTIYGFLGRNGAGKTTALKIIAGLIKPDSGSVRVLGTDPFEFTTEDRQRVGYLSEKQILPSLMKVGKLLEFCAPFYPGWDQELVDRLLASFRIDRRKRISVLSQGAQRQVAFILALAQRPELLLLDEPASTLDVVARREFLDEILDLLRQDGPTVFLSSHILSDIERVADHVGILADGTLKISEPLDRLKDTVKRVRFFGFDRDPASFAIPGAFRAERSGREWLVTLRVEDPAQLDGPVRSWGARYEIQDLNLEDIFVEVSRHQNP